MPSGYLLTYGGFMLLGGRMADLLGRRRILVSGIGLASQMLSRVGTRPVIVAGALVTAGGIYWLSRISVGGSYLTDLLPGMVIMSLGVGPMFVGVMTAANSGVPADRAGLAAALVNASQQVGGALGLAIFMAASALVALRATNTRGERLPARVEAVPEPVGS